MLQSSKKLVKKQAAVSAISTLVTASLEAHTLQHASFIHYLVQYQRDQAGKVIALIDSNSEVNAITAVFAARLGLPILSTGIGAQKIDGSALKTYGMVIAGFSIQDKLSRARFFEETFLLADISMEVVLEIPFLPLSNADI